MKTFLKKIIIAVMVFEARLVIKKYKPGIVAITGSVGKTSTRNAVYTVLASKFFTRKSEKSLPNDLLVPLTILGQPYGGNNPFIWFRTLVEGFLLTVLPYSYPKWLVLEMGADRPGDIKDIVAWLKPDIAIITSFGFGETPVHVEFFPSIDELMLEKSAIARALVPDGLLIFNHDDEKVKAMAETVSRRRISCGFGSGADVQALETTVIYGPYDNSATDFPRGIACKAEVRIADKDKTMPDSRGIGAGTAAGGVFSFEIDGALGRQHVVPLLAAVAVGMGLSSSDDSSEKFSLSEITAALKNNIPPRGRMRLLPGIRDTLVIDDTYNSSPIALTAALDTLKNLKSSGRKIAVLGDMLELGRYSIAAHRRMGEEAAVSADILVAVGIRSREAVDTALDKGLSENTVLEFDTSTEAGKYITDNILQPGDVILVKGSQAVRMERCVEEIMEHREEKEKLLVRQDREWLRR